MTKQELGGYYKIEAFKIDGDGVEISGSRRTAADWFPNLITDGGLDRYGAANNDYLNFCQVGSGSAAPSFGDSALASRVAGTNTTSSSTTGIQSSAPYYIWRRYTFRFVAGTATGNLSEVGVGWLSTAALFSRALILDAGSSPTTITILSDEVLDVTYELRFYMPTTDISGNITLDDISYAWVSRASFVTNGTQWAVPSSAAIASAANHTAYTGAIGAITASPTGTSLGNSLSVTGGTYTPGSLSLAGTILFGLNNANGSIKSIKWRQGVGSWQIEFTPAIPKTSAKELSLVFTHSWARR